MKNKIEIKKQNRKKYLELRNYVALLDKNDVAEIKAMLLHALDNHNIDYSLSNEIYVVTFQK
tara:strand:- start:1827 stop:2012 length:186 start_codon:yes stop_codon:yes gene_type:complete